MGGWTWSYEQPKRQRIPITDFRSGLKEARDEITTGMKDGMKALVMEPMHGLKEGVSCNDGCDFGKILIRLGSNWWSLWTGERG